MKTMVCHKALLAAALAVLVLAPARSAELDYSRVRAHDHHWRHIVLPPERHVIEVVRNAYGPHFVINGANFTAKSPACMGWTAGDRITLLAGSWHGACVDAAFYNVSRRRACEMWCG